MRVNKLFTDAPLPLRQLKRLIPLAVRDDFVLRTICSDRQSRENLRRAHQGVKSAPIPVRLRALGGKQLLIRCGTDDPWIVRETVTYADCLPPADIEDPRAILDLGANIGASMALLATRFPRAQIIGVEPDPANAQLCRENVRPWSDRCEVVEAAAWTRGGTVRLSGENASALSVANDGLEVRAMTVTSLLDEFVDGHADYVKFDVEGAEMQLLSENTDWVSRVSGVSVEVHAPYTGARCATDLHALGFAVTTKPAPRAPRVIGLRARPSPG